MASHSSPSTTALGVAWLRAAHQILDDEPRVLVDPVVVPLLGPRAETHVRAREAAYRTPGLSALRAHVVLRSRFTEDRLQRAVERGVRQYVLLGAGFDTFAYRQPEWARVLRIIEVDQPASQQAKRDRIEAAGIPVPSNLTFAAIDFERQTLRDGLVAHGVDLGAPAFVSCLGVLVYLTRAAVVDLFAFVASLPPGSECAFTFGGRGGPPDVSSSLASMAARVGEPFRSPLDLDEVRAILGAAGLGDPELLTLSQAAAYLGDRRDGLSLPRRASTASVIV
jgi:methyltransferase (TIGR00027 family)